MKVRIGIVGFGEFAQSFMNLFQSHPDIELVVGAELMPERREEVKKKFNLPIIYSSYEEMLEQGTDLNCIGIFTQRHQHGPMIIQALKAGKHVFSAVPVSCTLEETLEIVELVKQTRLTCMIAETCYYFPCAIFCRERYKAGAFGKFVYGESQYYHDITEMFDSFSSGGTQWKRIAGIPPMYYPTHSISMLFSAIGEHATEVSCFGFKDPFDDETYGGIYGEGKNDWDNPFSNETAIFRMSGGGIARINEFRRVGKNKPSSFITGLYGTHATYECAGTHHIFDTGTVFGQKPHVEYVGDQINTMLFEREKDHIDRSTADISYAYHMGYSKIHDLSRLPVAWRTLPDKQLGHSGSHPFLVDDFVRAVLSGKLPPCNVWDAANWMIPGLIAHESAMQNGKSLPIPYVGEAPEDWPMIDYSERVY